jgi:uncharacterized protein (TIGR02453 family)
MMQSSTVKFLKDLSRNNNRDWFEKNRHRYDAAKKDFETLVEQVIGTLAASDKRLTGLQPKDCIFRIYRDVRFSKDKRPYKTNMAASFTPGGRKSGLAGFYFQIDPSGEWGNLIAGGEWMPESPRLKAIRQEIQYNIPEFKSIIGSKNFKKWFKELEDHKLKKLPKGIDKDDPNGELYKYTSYIVSHGFDEQDLYSGAFLKKCGATYKAMLPLLDFLNRAV